VIDAVIEGEFYSFDAPWKRGGEANVYRFQPQRNFTTRFGSGQFVVKIYRVGKTLAFKNAQQQRQPKLRNFPRGLPSNVASPVALVFNREGEVIGYVMALVPDAAPLIKLKRKEYRDAHGISIFRLLKIFANLRNLVRSLHALGVVIGDLNDKNVLVGKNDEVFLIDADSLQFGPWKCVALVPGFADSRIIRIKPGDPKQTLQLTADFDELSDWLAYDVMLCQVLLGTNPMTGGICTLADGQGKLLQGNRRIVANISIFHSAVRLSDVASSLSILPEALLSRWEGVFSERVDRSPFPENLLDPTTWIDCPQCQTEHGRPRCPTCNARGVEPIATLPKTPARTTFAGAQIIAAAFHGSMRYLTYHDGAFRREDGTVLWRGAYDGQVEFAISSESTIFAKGSRFVVSNGSQPPREFETHAANGVATNSRYVYWVNNDSIVRSSDNGSVTIGPAPSHLTSVWAGERFGVAVVQTGIINQILTFDTEDGLNGVFNLPPESGTVTDVHCVVGEQLAWVTMLVRTNGAETIRCFVVDQRARLIASVEAPRSTAPWLDAFTASTALAFRDKLIVAVPSVGLVRIGIVGHTPRVEKISDKNKHLVTKEPTVGLILTDKDLLHVSTTSATTVS
jgi:hypothetical protein